MRDRFQYSFQRYLEAKRSVDDRALNRLVWNRLHTWLASYQEAACNIFEVGAGIGTMLQRIVEWERVGAAHYLGLDLEKQHIQFASQRLPQVADFNAYQLAGHGNSFLIQKSGSRIEVEFREGSLEAFATSVVQPNWDLVIAHAVLDLLDTQRALRDMFRVLKPGGHFYFSINYDGLTSFEPVVDRELDMLILGLYDRSMDDRMVNGVKTGGSQSGRNLFHAIPASGGEIIETGASDWVVYPTDGRYQQDEAYFLFHILHFIESTLTGHPALDKNEFGTWLSTRRKQIEEGKLVFIAHQLDFWGKIK